MPTQFGGLPKLVKELGFKTINDTHRDEIKSNARFRIFLDFFLGLLRDDDAYFGWIYQYLIAVLSAPKFNMMHGLIVQRIIQVAG